MNAAVIVFPGSNCERDVRVALRRGMGREPLMIWHGESELPALDLLSTAAAKGRKPSLAENAREQNAKLLLTVLEDFGIYGQIDKVRPGPVVTLYEFIPRAGTRTARVIALASLRGSKNVRG